jgi:Zinc finger, C3HC4 type (RING finger)
MPATRSRAKSAATASPAKASPPKARKKVSATKRKPEENKIIVGVRPPVPAAVAPQDLSATVQGLYCPVCLDVLVSTMILVPCGHGICLACSKQETKCPECRGPIVSAARCWAIDSVISSHMETQSKNPTLVYFPADDVRSYHDRLKKLKAQPAAKAAPASQPNAARSVVEDVYRPASARAAAQVLLRVSAAPRRRASNALPNPGAVDAPARVLLFPPVVAQVPTAPLPPASNAVPNPRANPGSVAAQGPWSLLSSLFPPSSDQLAPLGGANLLASLFAPAGSNNQQTAPAPGAPSSDGRSTNEVITID